MSSLLFGGSTWMPHYPFSSKDDLKKSCWKNIHFGRVVVWYGVNWKIIHFSETSIPFHFTILPFLKIILALKLYSIHIVVPGVECMLPPKHQRRPYPFLLSLSFFYGWGHCTQQEVRVDEEMSDPERFAHVAQRKWANERFTQKNLAKKI